ncbi:hypothetical protein ACF1HA_13115 [Streptomyces gardneri]|uniref:hypothetical protein n=1 Tax=Streptomyces gardneri TaxID=66892 RepID=UPI0036FA5E42
MIALRASDGRRTRTAEHALVEVDVVPVQAQGFALAHAGADENLEQTSHLRIGLVAVGEEAGRLLCGPDPPLRRRRPAQDWGRCRVVGEAVLAHGIAERAGEGGQAPVEGRAAAAGGELAGDEGRDVAVGELVELEGAERFSLVCARRGARANLALRGLYVFTHGDAFGRAPAHELFERITVKAATTSTHAASPTTAPSSSVTPTSRPESP